MQNSHRKFRHNAGLAKKSPRRRPDASRGFGDARQFKRRTDEKLTVEQEPRLRHCVLVKATTKSRIKSEAQVLDHATNNLLRALKKDLVKKEGRVDSTKLRKDGYSDRLVAKLEAA